MKLKLGGREKYLQKNVKTARVVKRFERKLGIYRAKKLKAEKRLAKIVESSIPTGPSDDLETITEEERVMYRRVGLKMKSYLPLGLCGVFDGVIENMHLHWKHRELVKLLLKEKELAFVEETARLLEYESGGILVAIERVRKHYAVIFYRGKNYRRPISIRPRNLLTKGKSTKAQSGIAALQGDKAPGPDGFPMSFYQSYWEFLKDDIMNTIHHFHSRQVFEKSFNATYIALIPKKTGAVELRDYRPISLISGVYKIIAKTLTERLKKELGI